ncbi:MAG TPA: hypothetical protein V6D11_17600 [Waterburya sp.]
MMKTGFLTDLWLQLKQVWVILLQAGDRLLADLSQRLSDYCH